MSKRLKKYITDPNFWTVVYIISYHVMSCYEGLIMLQIIFLTYFRRFTLELISPSMFYSVIWSFSVSQTLMSVNSIMVAVTTTAGTPLAASNVTVEKASNCWRTSVRARVGCFSSAIGPTQCREATWGLVLVSVFVTKLKDKKRWESHEGCQYQLARFLWRSLTQT